MAIPDRAMEILASTVARMLVSDGVVFSHDEAELRRLVLRVLEEDRDQEMEIIEAAKALLKKHAGEISSQGMDTGELYRRFRQQIARERGFAL